MSNSDKSTRTQIINSWWFPVAIPIVVTAVLTLGIFFGLGPPGSNQPHEYKPTQKEYYETRCNESIANGFLPIEGDVSATVRHHKSPEGNGQTDQKPDYPDYCDLAAQYRSAAATESTRTAAWLAFILSVVGVWGVLRSLKHSRDAVVVTRDIGEAQTRAHLLIESAEISAPKGGDIWPVTNGKTSVVVRLVTRNLGNTVATSIGFSGELIIETSGVSFSLPIEEPPGPEPWIQPRVNEAHPAMMIATKGGDGEIPINETTRIFLLVTYRFKDIFGEKITQEVGFGGRLFDLEFNDDKLAPLTVLISDGIPKMEGKAR